MHSSPYPYFQGYAALSVGVLSHIFYFGHGRQHSKQSAQIMLTYIVLEFGLLLSHIHNLGFLPGVSVSVLLSFQYAFGLFGSILIYRLLFHRIRHIPGPFFAKITKVYAGPWLNQNMKMHQEHIKLLDRYGDVVRIGPNEVMVCDVDVLAEVHSAKYPRGMVYENMQMFGRANLSGVLDWAEHRKRRQIWERGLSPQNTRIYETYTDVTIKDWLNKLEQQAKAAEPVDISLFSKLIAFDNMGRVGFSKDFGLVGEGKENHYLSLIEWLFQSISILGSSLSWPVPIARALHLDARGEDLEEIVLKETQQRLMKNNSNVEDILKYFIDDFVSESPKSFVDIGVLYSDASGMMTAATDTIAAALSYAFFYLAADRNLRTQLRGELRDLVQKNSDCVTPTFLNHDLERLQLLNAFINETLRMHPSVASNGSRFSPPQGLVVGKAFIPGNVEIFVPIYAYHRCERYFKHADKFIVERWTTRPELIIDKRAFHPFLIGPGNCVGRQLAMMVLRKVLATTVFAYDFEFPPGDNGSAIFTEMRNQIIMKAGPLSLMFVKVKQP